ncbi:hypothetical protein GW17_00057701 [Ensete ventricosum]|nr:hypothetical protein GW17_00057701 [Ensete ventricosum]
MRCISRAAFEIDDYWRIVEILHKRLGFRISVSSTGALDRRRWREPYKALILLEYLLTHGPGSIADEFQSDAEAIRDLGNLEYIDERGLALVMQSCSVGVRSSACFSFGGFFTGIDPQIRRAAGTARRRPLQETSGYNNSATEGTASPATTKMHLPEESKPLLHY